MTKVVIDPDAHPDDGFHVPIDDDPAWTETCWFTFTVPERDLSAQLYPFFRPNLGVVAAGAYVWDPSGDQVWSCRYAKNFWHLPLPAQPLTDIALANGIRYRTLEPEHRYHVVYDDPDAGERASGATGKGDALHIDVTFTGICPPSRLGETHLDQPCRVEGRIVLDGEDIAVDGFGFRDRSWGHRSQVGEMLVGGFAAHGGYSYATASAADAFHTITMDWGEGCRSIHGFLLRDGTRARLAEGLREVVDRDADGFPRRVRITGTDELGRELEAEGRCRNRLVFPINPNLLTVNCLTEWTFGDVVAVGEDHDNWSAAAIRRHVRSARAVAD
ncbi:MAG TPA: hypothetical protein VF228_05985 [Iamia sp.]